MTDNCVICCMMLSKLRFSILSGLFISVSPLVFAQPSLPEPKDISAEEIQMKDCAFDSGAGAVILFDAAWTEYESNTGAMITTHRKRIKILTKSGMDEGTLVIPFYSKNGFERITDVEGETANITAGGAIEWTELQKKSVFTEKGDQYWSRVKIVMPDVVQGSIFEVRYKSVMENYGGLDYWNFQTHLPAVKSCYYLQIVPGAEFTYNIQKKNDLDILVRPLPEKGCIYFEMNKVPALDYEPFMDAPDNYRQKVIFQLSSYSNERGGKTKVSQTWEQLADELLDNDGFGKQLNKKVNWPELAAMVAMLPDKVSKTNAIFNYVRSHVKWNGYYSKYSSVGIKKTAENGEGNAADINLLLVSILRNYGVEAYPLLVAERDFGKINPDYPFIEKFNKVVAYVFADSLGKPWIMDATNHELPANLTPYKLLNTTAFLVKEKKPVLINIVRPADKYIKKITINATISDDYVLHGNAVIEKQGYAKMPPELLVGGLMANPLGDALEEKDSHVEIIKSESVVAKSDSLPNFKKISFTQNLVSGGQFLYITSNIFTGLETNPFASTKRFTDVNFGYPFYISLVEKIILPAGSKIKELPEQEIVKADDVSIVLTRSAKVVGDTIEITSTMVQSITLVEVKDYGRLRDFYAKMIARLESPVVVELTGKPAGSN